MYISRQKVHIVVTGAKGNKKEEVLLVDMLQSS